MAICHGNWINSLINGEDDGTIEVQQGGAGLLGGRHGNSQKEIFGFCNEIVEPPHISFVRFENGSAFVYNGDIERRTTPRPHFKIVNGTVTVVPPRGEEKALVDDWTAEKPT